MINIQLNTDGNTKADAVKAIQTLRGFIGVNQLSAVGTAMRGEEKQFFFDMMVNLAGLVTTMPKTYEQDGKGDQAIVYLHYFINNMDWYITEKDIDTDGEGQIQAFGYADFGDQNAELGYISISELIKNNVELDFYWVQKTLAEVKQK